jgi:hypothetical protein
MTTPEEYRQFARECAKWAIETQTEEHKTSFLALAKDWLYAAMASERASEKRGPTT